jgi:DNA repair exonuclease SbcCD ATPase subunit
MIQLEHLHIEEFRGIRAIDLPLDSKSFVVHGPNGSGKSGVVDAIDFALTGNIGRLVGSGTGGVTLARHGPHVHKRDNPAAAIVALTLKDVESGATAVLTRTIADPSNFTLEPDSPAMRDAVAQAQAHPELTLSRREIIKYVVSKPADRAQEVQALLKLDRLDLFRRLLRSALTKTSSDLSSANSELQTAEQ